MGPDKDEMLVEDGSGSVLSSVVVGFCISFHQMVTFNKERGMSILFMLTRMI